MEARDILRPGYLKDPKETTVLGAIVGLIEDHRLICIDLTPRNNSQINNGGRKDVLQVGGFSDTVYDVVASYLEHGDSADHWVKMIEAVDLDQPLEK